MCGIAGFIETHGPRKRSYLEATVRDMIRVLEHRGPDHGAVWTDEEAGLALGHRRLSILDLSPLGNQPMRSSCGRYMVVYNGEIYNFRDIRKNLEHSGSRFNGGSDTEVMLEAISRWGIDRALAEFNGMFAFALWDIENRKLLLGRDRFGEKPLYYGWAGSTFLFGSELKALKAHPSFRGDLNTTAVQWYFRLTYIPAPFSIYRSISKLLPGSTITIDAARPGYEPEPKKYWSLDDVFSAAKPQEHKPTDEVVRDLDGLLRDAVKLRLESDVPLGAFLSGGVDSSTVVALMTQQTSRPVKTFTIGFEDAPSEIEHARAVARHLATDHTEWNLSAADALAVVPKLAAMFDEPFADSSEIPTHLVSMLARRQVTVALSGDGGDELFCGYSRYIWAQKLNNYFGWLPQAGRGTLGQLLGALPVGAAAQGVRKIAGLLPGGHQPDNPLGAMQRLAGLLKSQNAGEAYLSLVSFWDAPAGIPLSETRALLGSAGAVSKDLVRSLMYLDSKFYLADDILVKLDRASMSVALESRVPLLDARIAEYLARLPQGYDLSGPTKPLLRKILYQYVPKELIERPKMGFGTPIRFWLRTGWRDWAASHLNQQQMACGEFVDTRAVTTMWNDHLAGRTNSENQLWAVLMFEAWLKAEKMQPEVSGQPACLAT